ncbi:MAG TPA: PIN domain-containing protein [Bryobacteraceae bacterium]|nr:PIN domain-containing protein [Bryobacteraceae bacterium]
MNGDDRYFVDSDVLLYAHDTRNEQKQRHAEAWLDWLWQSAVPHVSWQVLEEFYSNAILKMRVPPYYVRLAVVAWSEWHPPDVTLGLLERAWFWSDQAKISFWDSMIVAAAERARCRWLLSEDFQSGREFGDLTVVNPFEHAPGSLGARPQGKV